MKFVLIGIWMLGAVLAHSAAAGPWGLAAGTGFASATLTGQSEANANINVFAKYGLRGDLTAEINLFGARNDAERTTELSTSLTRHWRKPGAPQSVGAGIVAGVISNNGSLRPYLGGGFAIGRAITLANQTGWAAIDSELTWRPKSGAIRVKLDTTIGVDLSETTQIMVQYFATDLDGSRSYTLAPSVLYSPSGAKYSIQIGAELPRSSNRVSVKFGFWRVF